jgi:hypothetical protein
MRYTDNTSLQQHIGQIDRTGSILDLNDQSAKSRSGGALLLHGLKRLTSIYIVHPDALATRLKPF